MGSSEEDAKQDDLHFSNVRYSRFFLLSPWPLLDCDFEPMCYVNSPDSIQYTDILAYYVRCALQHMLAGAVAGILEHTLMFPVDTIKTRMQALSHPGQQAGSICFLVVSQGISKAACSYQSIHS